MGINLTKGEKVNLSKTVPSMNKIIAGLGWNTGDNSSYSRNFDLDVSVFLLGENGKATEDRDLIFYNNLSNKGVTHKGDNRTGAGDGDDEQVEVILNTVPENIHKIVFTVTIHEAEARRQNFGQVNNAYIRLVDQDTNNEVLKYDLSEDFSVETSLIVGEIYRNSGDWKFNAVGTGIQGDLGTLCTQFGL